MLLLVVGVVGVAATKIQLPIDQLGRPVLSLPPPLPTAAHSCVVLTTHSMDEAVSVACCLLLVVVVVVVLVAVATTDIQLPTD